MHCHFGGIAGMKALVPGFIHLGFNNSIDSEKKWLNRKSATVRKDLQRYVIVDRYAVQEFRISEIDPR